jgi:hypothetical protein
MLQTNTEFFMQALLAATNKPRDPTDQPLTEKDVLDMFFPTAISTLTRIEEMCLDVLANSGLECAQLDVKWGADDETANTPPEAEGSVRVKLEVPGWEIWMFDNLVQIFPRGPGSGGAGATEIWFIEAEPPHPSFH